MIEEGKVDSDGNFQFNGTFRAVVGGLITILCALIFYWLTSLTSNVIANDKESRMREAVLTDRVTRIEIAVAQMSALGKDMDELKQLLRRNIPNQRWK